MTRAIKLFFFLLSCHAALATTVIPVDFIQVTPTNATEHEISFSYTRTDEYFTVTMPYAKGEQTFDRADLECTNSLHRFYIPLKCLQSPQVEGKKDIIFIYFKMDAELARECTLTIFFTNGFKKGTEYMFSIKDFVPARKSAEEGPAANHRLKGTPDDLDNLSPTALIRH